FPLKDTDTLKWVQEVYETIQRKISYVDIEDALGALIPRAPGMNWNNKYGDCKDMAFLVHSILKSKGVTSYIAISRSLSLEDTFDFPSISLANHVICVAYINN